MSIKLGLFKLAYEQVNSLQLEGSDRSWNGQEGTGGEGVGGGGWGVGSSYHPRL